MVSKSIKKLKITVTNIKSVLVRDSKKLSKVKVTGRRLEYNKLQLLKREKKESNLETMKKSIITKLLTYAGAVLVQRSWRDSGESVSRDIRSEDPDKIKLALKDGWVITFPRGTTDNSKPIRKGI